MRKQKNQLQSFQRAFFIDWKLGVLHRAWRFLPALFLAAFCVLKGMLFQRYEVPHDLSGILSLMFFGDDVVTPNSLSLCLEWVGFQIFLLLITNDYTSSSLGSFGECMLMKTGSKSAWWLSKCCWMVCTVTISFVALILTGITLCPMFHYTVRLSGMQLMSFPDTFAMQYESCAAVNGVQSMKDISTVPVGETAKIVFPVAVSERMLPSSKCGEEAIRAAEYRLILTNYPERQEIVLSS